MPGFRSRAFLRFTGAALLCVGAASCSDDGPIAPLDPGLSGDVPSQDSAGDIDAKDAGFDPVADTAGLDLAADDAVAQPDDGGKTDAAGETEGPACPAAGSVLFTEFLPNPKAGQEPEGEYLELHNPGTVAIDLRGSELHSGTSVHAIEGTAPVEVPPGGYLLLARSADAGINGGLVPGYVYDRLQMANTKDDVVLTCGDVVIDGFAYDAATWPLKEGKAVVLDPSGYDASRNDDPTWWCRATATFGGGDAGSPGLENEACGATSCGDKVVQRWEACDDGNPVAGDGCENDCTASVDGDGDTVPDSIDNCPAMKNQDQADSDQDGVGNACEEPGCGNGNLDQGEDCDDANPVSGDGCSATCRTESFAAGSIVVSEFLYDPLAVGEDSGEWVELYNPGNDPIDIAGWVLKDDGTNLVRILPASGVLAVPAKGFVVLGQKADLAANGGADVDWAYGGKFQMANTADEIVLSWNDHVIDRVGYDVSAGFPKATGRSLQLEPVFLQADLNDEGGAWCATPDAAVMAGGDRGTPGAANLDCGF